MLQFERLLRVNNISETDPELPRAIEKQIQKLRNKQKSITAETSAEDKERIEDEIDAIDDSIMKSLPDFFEIEDEEEENKKKAEAEAKAKAKQKAEAEAAEKANAEKAKKSEEEELNKPATNDNDALDKLFRKGKLRVTENDLEAAGFNLSFWSSKLTPEGCDTKNYRLVRRNISQPYYDLIKK